MPVAIARSTYGRPLRLMTWERMVRAAHGQLKRASNSAMMGIVNLGMYAERVTSKGQLGMTRTMSVPVRRMLSSLPPL